jgi:hypothetical protein
LKPQKEYSVNITFVVYFEEVSTESENCCTVDGVSCPQGGQVRMNYIDSCSRYYLHIKSALIAKHSQIILCLQ